MADALGDEAEQYALPPPGQRWGAGAQSVLPYLTKSLQAKPSEPRELRELRGRETPSPSAPPA